MAQKPRIDLNIASNAGTIAKNFKDLAQAITRVTQLRNAINAEGKKNKPLSFDIDFKQMSRLEKVAESIKTSLGSLAAEGEKVKKATAEMFDSDPTKSKAVTSVAALNVLLEQTRTLINSLDNKTVEINGNNTGLVNTINNSLSQLKKLNRKITVDIGLESGGKGDSYKTLWKNYVNAAQSAMKSSKKFAEFAKGDTFKIPSYTKDYKAFFEEYNKATDIEGKMSALARHFKGNHAFGQLINAINNNAIDKLGIKGKNFDKVVDAVRPFADMSKMLDYRKNGKSDELKPKTIKIEGDISGLKTAVEEAHRLINGLPTKTIKIEGQVTAKAKGGGGGKQKKPVNWDDEYRDVWGSKPEKLSKKLNRINDLQDAINSGLWTNAPDDAMQKLQFKKMEYSKARSATKNNLTVTQDYNLDLAKREQAEIESAQRVANRRRTINQARLIMERNDEAKKEQKISEVDDKYRGAVTKKLYDEREKLIGQLKKIQSETKIAGATTDKYNEACRKELELLKRINEIEDHRLTDFPASGMTSKLNNKLGAKERHDAFIATQEAIKKQKDAGEVKRLELEDQRLQKQKQETKELTKQQKIVDGLYKKLDDLKRERQVAIDSQTRPSDKKAVENDLKEADIFKALMVYGENPNAKGYFRQWNIGNRNRLNELIPENTKAQDHTQRLLTIQGQYNEEIARQNALLERGEMVTQKYVDNSVAKLEKLKREYEELGGETERLSSSRFSDFGNSSKRINEHNSVMNAMAWRDEYFVTANSKVNALTHSLEILYTELRKKPSDKGLKQDLNATSKALQKARQEAKEVAKQMKIMEPENLTKGWQHKLRWIGGAFGFYETYDFLMRFGETISGVDENMKNLATVMPQIHGSSKEATKALQEEQTVLLEVASAYGSRAEEIIESARLWGRMYKNQETVNTLTRQSAKLAIADNFSIEESTKAVEAAMFQYGLVAKSAGESLAYSNEIVDVYTKLSHNAGVSAQDLAAGVERSGAVAHQAGMDFEFLTSLIAQATRSTALSGLTNTSPFMLETA